MILTEQIASLQQQLAAAQQQAQQNFAQFTAAQATIDRSLALLAAEDDEEDEDEEDEDEKKEKEKGKKASLETRITAVLTDRTQLRADLKTAKESLKAESDSRETAIAAEVANRLAAAGSEPIKRDPAAVAPTEPPVASGGTPTSRLAATITIAG